MLQEASTKLRHLDPSLSCLAATGTSENLLMALLGNVDSRRNTPHIRSGAFQSHFSNSSYSSILAQVVWGVKIPSSTVTHVGYNQYVMWARKSCVFFIDNSLSAQLVPWLPIPAQRHRVNWPETETTDACLHGSGIWCVSLVNTSRACFSKEVTT